MTNIWTKLGKLIINPALVAQRIEHLTTDQKVGGSSPSKRTFHLENTSQAIPWGSPFGWARRRSLF